MAWSGGGGLAPEHPALADLRAALGPARVLAAGFGLELYDDQGIAARTRRLARREALVQPLAVVRVDDEGVAVTAVRLAAGHGLDIVPFGAGTGLRGGASPRPGCLVLDLRPLAWMQAVDPIDRTVRVGAGLSGPAFEGALRAAGWTCGHAPLVLAGTVGGWFATRAVGTSSTRHGAFVDRVESVRVLLPDGRGMDLACGMAVPPGQGWAALLAGSEGRFATVLALTVRVARLPGARWFRAFDCGDTQLGLTAMRTVAQRGVRPELLRLEPLVPDLAPGLARLPERVQGFAERHLRRQALHLELRLPHLLYGGTRTPLGRGGPARLWVVHGGEPGQCDVEGEWLRAMLVRMGLREAGAAPAEQAFADTTSPFAVVEVAAAGGAVDVLDLGMPWSRAGAVWRAVQQALDGKVLSRARFEDATPHGCALHVAIAAAAATPQASAARVGEAMRLAVQAAQEAGASTPHCLGTGRFEAAPDSTQGWAATTLQHHVWTSLSSQDSKDSQVSQDTLAPGARNVAHSRPRALLSIQAVQGLDRSIVVPGTAALGDVEAMARAGGLTLPFYEPWLLLCTVNALLAESGLGQDTLERLPIGPGCVTPRAAVLGVELAMPDGRLLRRSGGPRLPGGPGWEALLRGDGDGPLRLVAATLALTAHSGARRGFSLEGTLDTLFAAAQALAQGPAPVHRMALHRHGPDGGLLTVRVDGDGLAARRSLDLVRQRMPRARPLDPDDVRLTGPIAGDGPLRWRSWHEARPGTWSVTVRCGAAGVWERLEPADPADREDAMAAPDSGPGQAWRRLREDLRLRLPGAAVTR